MNPYEVEPILLDTSQKQAVDKDEGLTVNRKKYYDIVEDPDAPTVSIAVLAYNRLSKTKYCVECILNYTKGIRYELILIDNGSLGDDIYQYFQSVPWDEKVIIRVNNNVGGSYPWNTVKRIYRGKYLAFIANDVYVTKNWFKNLMACLESDPMIGLVMPVSSNVSNLQQVSLPFTTMEEMQRAAASYNRSDSSCWEERMRLITLVTIYKKEILDLVGIMDSGFYHDFSEDDFAARLRRNGYKMILCKDTYVHHDHDFRRGEDKNVAEFQQSLANGRKAFQEKYHGLDAWSDVLNFETGLISQLAPRTFRSHTVRYLCIDVKCGTPVLEIRNRFRENKDHYQTVSYGFTTDAKYYSELQQQTDYIACDRMDFIQEHYLNDSMDLILLGEPLNSYPKPIMLLQKLLHILKNGGILLFKIRNTYDCQSLLESLKIGKADDLSLCTCLPMDELHACLEVLNVNTVNITYEPWSPNEAVVNMVQMTAHQLNPKKEDEIFNQLLTKHYLYYVQK